MGDLEPKAITPQKLSGSNLNVFVQSYLELKQKRRLFTDKEFQDTCSEIVSIAGNRAVTVLLAKLFVDQKIAKIEYLKTKKEYSFASNPIEELPQTIPDVMVNSIEILNRHETKDSFNTEVVIVGAKALALRSLEDTLTPISIRGCLKSRKK